MVGQPIRSIRELLTPSLPVQVKPGREGNRWRQTSTQQQLVKSLAKPTELSRESLSTHEPRRSTAWSKTELKSPARIVGTVGSTYVCTLYRKSFRCGFRSGHTKKLPENGTHEARTSPSQVRPFCAERSRVFLVVLGVLSLVYNAFRIPI